MVRSWDDLAAASLARQFPDGPGRWPHECHATGDLQPRWAPCATSGSPTDRRRAGTSPGGPVVAAHEAPLGITVTEVSLSREQV